MSVNPKPRPSVRVGEFDVMKKRLSRLRYRFNKMKRGQYYEKGGAGLVYALAYLIEIRSCYPRRDIIQISVDI